jgi:hypothetical protein
MPIITSINLHLHAHSICLLLNSCSILCHICPTPFLHPHYRDLLALAASLSSVHFLACSITTAQAAPEPMQSMQSALLRKRIQAENWRLMLNRVLYSAQMQELLTKRRASQRGEAQVMCRTHSAAYEEKKKARTAMRKSQSWSEASISDFHAEERRNLQSIDVLDI